MGKRVRTGFQTLKSCQRAPALACVMAVFLAVNLISCSPQKRHRVLTFFFDDVPPLEKVAPSAEEAVVAETDLIKPEPLKPVVVRTDSTHKPYAEKRCNSCHGTQFSMAVIQEATDLCKECHANFVKPFETLHGPVSLFECQICHHPHVSKRLHLLKKETRDLCFWCHDESQTLDAQYHVQSNEKKCSACHDPHGGGKMFLHAESVREERLLDVKYDVAPPPDDQQES